LTTRLAGSRSFPLYALVRHHGRRSGRAYATPVVTHPTSDGFLIPLAFGEGADWFRNLRSAGAGVIRWRGVEYEVVEPEVVEWASVRSASSPVERLLVPLFGATRFVHLRHAHREDLAHD
jgi:deazaflavin-dependent oxidoreductase (nitroreductase family)